MTTDKIFVKINANVKKSKENTKIINIIKNPPQTYHGKLRQGEKFVTIRIIDSNKIRSYYDQHCILKPNASTSDLKKVINKNVQQLPPESRDNSLEIYLELDTLLKKEKNNLIRFPRKTNN